MNYTRGEVGNLISIKFLSADFRGNILVKGESGIHVVSTHIGSGRLTVLSDAYFAGNNDIGNHDHAAFLWHLFSLQPSKSAWLIYGQDVPSLWDHLVEDAWMVLISLSALVAVLVWASCRRFGPLIPTSRYEDGVC